MVLLICHATIPPCLPSLPFCQSAISRQCLFHGCECRSVCLKGLGKDETCKDGQMDRLRESDELYLYELT